MMLSKGFTLIELILVVLIIASLVALATPAFRQTFNNMQFEQACSDLAGVLNYARASAIFKRTECKVMINKESLNLASGININSDKDSVSFYPDGTSGAINITLSNSTKQRSFTMEGSRGYVKIK